LNTAHICSCTAWNSFMLTANESEYCPPPKLQVGRILAYGAVSPILSSFFKHCVYNGLGGHKVFFSLCIIFHFFLCSFTFENKRSAVGFSTWVDIKPLFYNSEALHIARIIWNTSDKLQACRVPDGTRTCNESQNVWPHEYLTIICFINLHSAVSTSAGNAIDLHCTKLHDVIYFVSIWCIPYISVVRCL
jgi:hypothetical protein